MLHLNNLHPDLGSSPQLNITAPIYIAWSHSNEDLVDCYHYMLGHRATIFVTQINVTACARHPLVVACMATSSSSVDMGNIPATPHQPMAFKFPKRMYGREKPVDQSSTWFTKWTLLHYDAAKDLLYYLTCLTAFSCQCGCCLCNWSWNTTTELVTGEGLCHIISAHIQRILQLEDATLSIMWHEENACYREAADVIITLPSMTRDAREQLFNLHCRDDDKWQGSPTSNLSYCFFLQTGLPSGETMMRQSNFSQWLSVKAHKDPNLASWLQRKENVYNRSK